MVTKMERDDGQIMSLGLHTVVYRINNYTRTNGIAHGTVLIPCDNI